MAARIGIIRFSAASQQQLEQHHQSRTLLEQQPESAAWAGEWLEAAAMMMRESL
jgi:hypothetical protein